MSSISPPPTVAGPLLLPTLAVPDAAAAPGNTNGLWRFLPMTDGERAVPDATARARVDPPQKATERGELSRLRPAAGGGIASSAATPGGSFGGRAHCVGGRSVVQRAEFGPLENRETFSVIRRRWGPEQASSLPTQQPHRSFRRRGAAAWPRNRPPAARNASNPRHRILCYCGTSLS